jgi:hypothetical protein
MFDNKFKLWMLCILSGLIFVQQLNADIIHFSVYLEKNGMKDHELDGQKVYLLGDDHSLTSACDVPFEALSTVLKQKQEVAGGPNIVLFEAGGNLLEIQKFGDDCNLGFFQALTAIKDKETVQPSCVFCDQRNDPFFEEGGQSNELLQRLYKPQFICIDTLRASALRGFGHFFIPSSDEDDFKLRFFNCLKTSMDLLSDFVFKVAKISQTDPQNQIVQSIYRQCPSINQLSAVLENARTKAQNLLESPYFAKNEYAIDSLNHQVEKLEQFQQLVDAYIVEFLQNKMRKDGGNNDYLNAPFIQALMYGLYDHAIQANPVGYVLCTIMWNQPVKRFVKR